MRPAMCGSCPCKQQTLESGAGPAAAGAPAQPALDAAARQLFAALAAVGGSLREASLTVDGLLVPPLGPWLAPLAGLTSLSLDWRGLSLVLNSSLACLAGLQRQTELLMLPGTSLPPALTSLHVCRYFGPLPIQVRAWRCVSLVLWAPAGSALPSGSKSLVAWASGRGGMQW